MIHSVPRSAVLTPRHTAVPVVSPKMKRCLFIAAVALAVCSCSLAAQVRGTVVDSGGAPVSAAKVEVWSSLRRTAGTTTDVSGRFSLGVPEVSGATGLVVSRVGYQTRAVPLTSADTTLRVQLQAEPVMLAGITSATEPRIPCPNREDPRARALWEAVRERYPAVPDTVVFHSLGTIRSRQLDRSSIGDFGDDRGRRQWTAATNDAWPVWRRLIGSSGYAMPQTQSVQPRYAYWRYVPLEDGFSQHFVEEQFGALHTLSIASSSGGYTTLAFCPRPGSRRVEVSGTLTVSPEGFLVRGAWRYRTPSPREDAGVELDFVPPLATRHSLLLVQSYLFWRRVQPRQYYVEAVEYEEWRLYPGANPPPVPTELYGGP
jgi:hypothetical protein